MRRDPHHLEAIAVRSARLQDASALSVLAIRTFRETFGPYTSPDDLAVYLAATYSPERQAAEIADPCGRVFLVEARTPQSDPVLLAYAYLFRSPAPAVVRGPTPLELKRFYVDAPWHGRGVAQMLMAEVLRSAESQGARTLWLGVWEHNARAAAFYRKYGFQRVGEHVFPVGADPQIDWVFARPLDPPAGNR